MWKLWLATVLLLPVFSSALMAGDDLDKFTTEQLMEEVGRRIDAISGEGGGGGAGGPNSFQINISCKGDQRDSSLFFIDAISKTDSKQSVFRITMTPDDCSKMVNVLSKKYKGNFNDFKLMDYCDGSSLTTIKVTSTSQASQVSYTNQASRAACLANLGVK